MPLRVIFKGGSFLSVVHMAKSETDAAGCDGFSFGDCMFPVALGRPTHDDELTGLKMKLNFILGFFML